MRLKIVKLCINQDTGEKLKPGDIVEFSSSFETGRHLAEKNAVPAVLGIERSISGPQETRRRSKKPVRRKTE